MQHFVKYPKTSKKLILREMKLKWPRKREEKGTKRNPMNKEFPEENNEFPEWNKEMTKRDKKK